MILYIANMNLGHTQIAILMKRQLIYEAFLPGPMNISLPFPCNVGMLTAL